MRHILTLGMVALLCGGCASHLMTSGGLGQKLQTHRYDSYIPQATSSDGLVSGKTFAVKADADRPGSPVEPNSSYLREAMENATRARGAKLSAAGETDGILLSVEFSRYVTRQFDSNLYRTFIDAEYTLEPLSGATPKLSPVVCSLSGVANTPQAANQAALDKLSGKIFDHQPTRDYLANLDMSDAPQATVARLAKPAASVQPSELTIGIPHGRYAGADDFAVVIGNQDYSGVGIPDVDFALRDSRTVKRYLETAFGFLPGNIIYVENASFAKFSEIFGNDRDYRGRLFRSVRPGVSRVFIYYVGHGAPDLDTGEAYFVPVDASPRYLKTNGYRLKTFYGNLSQVPARDFMIVLDSCFSGDSAKGMLFSGISSIALKTKRSDPQLDNALVFTSSKQDQVSSWHNEKGHSLFTYYFLKGLQGDADGNRDRVLTGDELQSYLLENVPYMAGRLNGLDQQPTVTGDLSWKVLSYN